MKPTLRKSARAAVWAATLSLTAVSYAQNTSRRIPAAIDSGSRITLPGTRSPHAAVAPDLGETAPATQLHGITMVFSMSAAQKADLDALLVAQQDPASPLYHQWLTPAEFGARFGMSDADLAAAKGWLEQQGFSIDSVANARNRIMFSGTAAQVRSAFGASLHNYRSATGATRFALSGNISLPSGLAGAVAGVTHLSSFRLHPQSRLKTVQPSFTSNQTGNYFLTPADVSTIYDITPAYNSGYNGTGQTIAVIGQSAILTSDITNFQTAAGVPVRAPNQVLVPGSGTSTIYTQDEAESDLDLEYASGIATGATINFVYAGNNPNFGVFDAAEYAIDNKLGQIITLSYGECESLTSNATLTEVELALQQAAAQGQTFITSSGDNGSTTCQTQTTNTAVEQALSVDYPASSAYALGMGGTMFPATAVASTNSTYFTQASGADVLSSAKGYIPEVVWNNDSSTTGVSSGGGGTSNQIARPSWQTGVNGIETGFYRMVPDISLDSSPDNAGYLYCSSDSSTNVTGSCSHGFRDTNNSTLTVAGGTSFAAPIFAGMLAIINQSQNNTAGAGLINPTLYTLAANSTTYASAFHDITSGNNACLAGTLVCGTGNGTLEYSATAGYDEATGLGSVDLNNLLHAWATARAVTPHGSFTLAATNVAVTAGNSATSTVTITPAGGYTGTITWSITSSPSLGHACYTIPNTTVSGTSPVTATLTIYASNSNCAAAALFGTTGAAQAPGAGTPTAANHAPAKKPFAPLPAEIAVAGLLGFACFTRRSRKLQGILAVALLAVVSLGVSGCSSSTAAAVTCTSNCGGSTGPTTPPVVNATAGTYTLTITGTDTTSASITAKTTLTLTIS